MLAGPNGCRGCVRRRVVPAQLCGAPFVYAALLPSARPGLGPSRVRRRVFAELGLVPRAGACVEGGGCGFGVKRTPPSTACERLVARCVRLCCRTRRRCEKPASLAQRRLDTGVSVRCDRASVLPHTAVVAQLIADSDVWGRQPRRALPHCAGRTCTLGTRIAKQTRPEVQRHEESGCADRRREGLARRAVSTRPQRAAA
ncbi:hypothetical protein ERJ75_001678000 [Trypanosoma vivax]|nr:hypothetical protein ERJ75_001678000 [Trypanosoma vivax]